MNKFAHYVVLKSTLILLILFVTSHLVNAQVSMDHLDSKIEKLDFKSKEAETQKTFQSLQSIIMKTQKDYSSSFFCNIEAQIEKQTKFLVRFRLGSVDYVDRMEGKIKY